MHPPEANGPANRSDAAKNECRCFEISHVRLRQDDTVLRVLAKKFREGLHRFDVRTKNLERCQDRDG